MVGCTADEGWRDGAFRYPPLRVSLQVLRTALHEGGGHLPYRLTMPSRARFVRGINPANDVGDLSREVPRLLLGIVRGNDQVIVRICCSPVRHAVPRTIGIEVSVLRAARRWVHNV